MEDEDLLSLETGKDFGEILRTLRRFVENNAQKMSFEGFSKGGKRQKLFRLLFQFLNKQDSHVCHRECLECLRILSRDKIDLNELIDEQRVAILLRMACIYTAVEASVLTAETTNLDITVAALKVLCNLAYNSSVSLAYVAKSHVLEGIMMRLRLYREPGVHPMIKLFDMKLLFLITALAPEVRPKLKEEYHGLVYLTETLDLVLKESQPALRDDHRVAISDADVELCCEILMVLFNVMTQREVNEEEVEDEAVCLRLTSIVHDILLSETSPSKQLKLRSHAVNLLTAIPVQCFTELTTQALPDLPKELELEGRDMSAVEALVEFLTERLNPSEKSKYQQELLCPILSVLVNMSRHQRYIRKYLRNRILPPLRDVTSRPEEGDTLRAHMCRLLTKPSPTIKDLAAELLFTLCKENVARMVKYTGYGNAAGMFANRGLLLGGNRSHSSSSHAISSDSDSETEEYSQIADRVNPVTGCYEVPRPNIFEGMSEEQKEHEAAELVNLLDKLHQGGVITPCRIGEDNRPVPIDHVLQLQEELPRQQVNH